MVLVSDKPSNNVGLLQTQLRHREGHETRRGGLEAMPLDQHIEGRPGEGQARLKIGPAPMHDLFAMADERQHREHRLDEQTVLPLAALTRTYSTVAAITPDKLHLIICKCIMRLITDGVSRLQTNK
jgi:hypothetical protein